MQTKAKERVLTQERLKEFFSYDPETGDFVRLKRGGETGKNVSRWQPGQVAGSITNRGYRVIRFGDFTYSAHRLAVLYMTGEWPADSVDHVDGDFANNRWSNLRECSHPENLHNIKKPASNTSGFLGVYRKQKKWASQICAYGKQMYLGSFATREEAHSAYLAAKANYHQDCPTPRGAE